METNALLARALALHFAVDASSSESNGSSLRRACCELAFQDVADVRVGSLIHMQYLHSHPHIYTHRHTKSPRHKRMQLVHRSG